MPKLPNLSGKEVLSKLERFGYEIVRQKGSHVRLKHADSNSHKPLTVPLHASIKPGLLHKIIKDAELYLEEFIDL